VFARRARSSSRLLRRSRAPACGSTARVSRAVTTTMACACESTPRMPLAAVSIWQMAASRTGRDGYSRMRRNACWSAQSASSSLRSSGDLPRQRRRTPEVRPRSCRWCHAGVVSGRHGVGPGHKPSPTPGRASARHMAVAALAAGGIDAVLSSGNCPRKSPQSPAAIGRDPERPGRYRRFPLAIARCSSPPADPQLGWRPFLRTAP
jgi:hypothetical protein